MTANTPEVPMPETEALVHNLRFISHGPPSILNDAADVIERLERALSAAQKERDEGEDNFFHVARILRGLAPDISPSLQARIDNAIQYIEQVPRTAYYTQEREGLMLAAENNLARAESTEAERRIQVLEHGLYESLLLQAHYATLLNQYDGGLRKTFSSIGEWVERLAALKESSSGAEKGEG